MDPRNKTNASTRTYLYEDAAFLIVVAASACVDVVPSENVRSDRNTIICEIYLFLHKNHTMNYVYSYTRIRLILDCFGLRRLTAATLALLCISVTLVRNQCKKWIKLERRSYFVYRQRHKPSETTKTLQKGSNRQG